MATAAAHCMAKNQLSTWENFTINVMEVEAGQDNTELKEHAMDHE